MTSQSVAPRSRKMPIWSLLAYAGLIALTSKSRSRSRSDRPSRPAAARREPLQNQEGRAHQEGRGRQATAPWQIPWAGWKDILWRTYQEITDDRLIAVAAGVVFYALLALFPAITALVSLYGLFAEPATITKHLSLLAGILPQGGFDIVQEQVNRIASKGNAKLGFGFIFGLGLALWSANAGMKAIIDALNVIYEEKEKRGFIKLNVISLTLTLGAILSLLFAIAAVVILPLVLGHLASNSLLELLLRILRWPALLLVIMLGLAVLYRFGPSRTEPRWEWLSVGSAIAAVAWLAGSALLSWYLGNFANYDATYGSLGAAIGLMMWLWLSSTVVLLGAELNSEIEHQTARDSTVGKKEPIGHRGAKMADTLGAAVE